MNRDQAVRMGVYDAIKSALTYESNAVHTYDSLTTNEVANEQMYVLLTSQSAVNAADFRRFRWNCVLAIEITSKQYSSVSKNIVDDISEQIEQVLIYPNNQPGKGGMIAQTGWEFSDVLLESVNFIDVELAANYYEITKILQVSCIVTKLS